MAIRRALVSVCDETGLAELAAALVTAGVRIVATWSTAEAIAGFGLPVTRVEDVTGFPEILDGRLEPFQLVVSNFYSLEQAGGGPVWGEGIERIDIGGPAAVRAAVRSHRRVAVVTSPVSYPGVVAALADGGFTLEQRGRLAAQALAHAVAYDARVAAWFAAGYAPDEAVPGRPEVVGGVWTRKAELSYGENPHQRAALYQRAGAVGGITSARVLHGKQMSYNSYVVADAARQAAYLFGEPCVAIMKHTNPCGIALGADRAQAHRRAYACDTVSAFGGVIAANGTVTAAMAGQIAGVLTDIVIAPDFEQAALDILTARKSLRLVRCPAPPAAPGVEWREVSGGMLVQDSDTGAQASDEAGGWQLVAGPSASDDALADLEFAWRACRVVKSNAILLAASRASVGIGMAQPNRLDSCRLALARAGERAKGSVAASDAYFPFPDGIEVLAEAGVRAVAVPGGSIRDDQVIEAARAVGISLYFTGARHFYH